jgi:transcriptional regulator with XRE-family HTH domain/tetratricopeptide (TPR) repeat protein
VGPGQVSIGEQIRAARKARGWSQARLARELGIAEGRGPYALDRQSIYRWETGRRIPDYWMPFIRQVLTLEEPSNGAATDLEGDHIESTDSVASVLALGRSDMERRKFLQASSAYALGALALPDLDTLTRRSAAAKAGAKVTVGRGEVEAVRQMTKVLGDAAAELGGGHARHLAVRYLTQDVAPWLNGTFTEATGRELFAATSQLVHLAGWMTGDEGNQGLAQKYYAHSYRLAAEAGDAELSATALRGMAVQAIDLGYRAAAVRLSERCVDHARHLDNPRATAYYQTTLANAATLDADRRTAAASLATAQSAIERGSDQPGQSWAAHYSPGRWAHEAGMILAQLGDLDAAEEHLNHALNIAGLDRRRTRAIVLADLGQVHLKRGDIAAALDTWNGFVDCADGIRSAKVGSAVQDMTARLDRLDCIWGVEELKEKAGTLWTPPTAA